MIRIICVFLVLCIFLWNANALAQNGLVISVDQPDTHEIVVSVSLDQMQEQLESGLEPVLIDSCGSRAHIRDARLATNKNDVQLIVAVAVSRWSCLTFPQLVCRGFKCKKVDRVSKTELYAKTAEIKYDLTPKLSSQGSGLSIHASVEPATRAADGVARTIPDFDRIEALLQSRIHAALEPIGQHITSKLPATPLNASSVKVTTKIAVATGSELYQIRFDTFQ